MTKEKILQDFISRAEDVYYKKIGEYFYITDGIRIIKDKDMPPINYQNVKEFPARLAESLEEKVSKNTFTIRIDKKWFNEWFKGKRRTNKTPMIIQLVDGEQDYYIAFNPYYMRDQFEYCKFYEMNIDVNAFGFSGSFYKYPMYTKNKDIECMTLPIAVKHLDKQPDLTIRR